MVEEDGGGPTPPRSTMKEVHRLLVAQRETTAVEGRGIGPRRNRVLLHARQMSSMMAPVSLLGLATWAVVLFFLSSSSSYNDGDDFSPGKGAPPFGTTFPKVVSGRGSGSKGKRTGDLLVQGLVNALLVMCIVVAITYAFAWLFTRRKRKAIVGLLLVAYAAPAALFVVACVLRLCVLTGGRVDMVTLVLLAHNTGGCVSASILADEWLHFVHRATPKRWQCWSNASILLSALSIAWVFLHFDEYTLGIFLILLVLWDIFAVLSRYGPIQHINAVQRQWRSMGERFDLPAGLSYSADVFLLGTGDLVFYGVLMGRAFQRDVATGMACFLAVLVGFSLTAVYAIVSTQSFVPALPLTIAVGLIVYILAVPFLEAAILHLLEAGVYI